MLPVVLSIALLVLLSVTVITVVNHEGKTQPTSERTRGDGSVAPEPGPPAAVVAPEATGPEPAPARPADPEIPADSGTPVVAAAAHPRHRFRSTVLLVLYVLVAGLLVAVAFGAAVAGLTVLLRDGVTS